MTGDWYILKRWLRQQYPEGAVISFHERSDNGNLEATVTVGQGDNCRIIDEWQIPQREVR